MNGALLRGAYIESDQIRPMERRAVVLTLALTVPLALYGVPYAYAITVGSTYVMSSSTSQIVHCNAPDYATGGGGVVASGSIRASEAVKGSSVPLTPADGTPDGWYIDGTTSLTSTSFLVFVVCQAPITVGGVTVPQFGSLYIAIALGAVLYFTLSRRFAGRPGTSAQVPS
jgi:hypothetical protein